MVQAVVVRVGGKQFSDIERGFREIDRRMGKGLDAAARPVSKLLLQSLQRVVKEMRRQHGTPWRAGGSGKNLFRRSGAGLRSIARSVHVRQAKSLDTVLGQIGAGFPISVHEDGATVTAKRARFLTIPLPAALDNRGIPLKRRARDWDNTFVARSKRGNLIIFQKQSDGGIVPLYVLKRSVTIPPRLRLGETLEKVGMSFFDARAIRVIERALDRVK